jgi:acyl-CoA thioester hydrolase
MTPPDSAVSIVVDIPFHDVDALHVVWHGHYFKYLEIARCALLEAYDLGPLAVRDLGFAMMVAESRIKYLSPMRYGEKLRVSCWFLDVEHRLNIQYELYNLTAQRRCAVANTVLVTVDPAGALCFSTPEAMRKRLPKVTSAA